MVEKEGKREEEAMAKSRMLPCTWVAVGGATGARSNSERSSRKEEVLGFKGRLILILKSPARMIGRRS